MNLYANIWESPAMILILLLISFGAIALIIFLIRKFVINKNKSEEIPTEEKVVKEDLERYLVDVEDEETQKQFDEFEKEDKPTKDENSEEKSDK